MVSGGRTSEQVVLSLCLTCEQVGGNVGGGNCRRVLGEGPYGYDPGFQGVPSPEGMAGGQAGGAGNQNGE